MTNGKDVNQNTGQVPYEGKGGGGGKSNSGKGWQTGVATMEKIMSQGPFRREMA